MAFLNVSTPDDGQMLKPRNRQDNYVVLNRSIIYVRHSRAMMARYTWLKAHKSMPNIDEGGRVRSLFVFFYYQCENRTNLDPA